MEKLVSISGVCERDIDLLLLEEFISSSDFSAWFLEKALLASAKRLGKCVNAQRSVTNSTGESDLEITFESNGSQTKVLIENKIGAGLQPRQADRYRSRALGYIDRSLCHHCYIIIVAPKSYFGQSEGAKGFDYKLTYEDILEWFMEASEMGSRRFYKASLLLSAIEKGTLGYQLQEDAFVSAFWKEYWVFACNNVPELNMREPGLKPAGSTFVAFRQIGLPRDFELIHKLTHGVVDLQIGGAGEKINDLNARLIAVMQGDMKLVRAGKSAAIRMHTPVLDPNADFGLQNSLVFEGLKKATALLEWFYEHSPLLMGFEKRI